MSLFFAINDNISVQSILRQDLEMHGDHLVDQCTLPLDLQAVAQAAESAVQPYKDGF